MFSSELHPIDNIVSFLHVKQYSVECDILEDTAWVLDFTDLLCNINNINVKVQEKKIYIDEIKVHLKDIKVKLDLFAGS